MLHWSRGSRSDRLAECLDMPYFCGVCWVCKQELGELRFCNISKPCNWSLALKQEKHPSDSCLSSLWQQHCSSVSCFAPEDSKLASGHQPIEKKLPVHIWRVQAWEWEWLMHLLLEAGKESQNCPSFLQVGSFQIPKHSSHSASYSWNDTLMCLQLPWRVELSVTMMWASELSVI